MLELYQAEGCPHSEQVRQRLTDLDVSYVAHNPRRLGDEGGDVLDEQVRDEMVAVGGENQIPLLVDHQRSETIYGSDDVVDYLDEHYE